MTANKPVRRLSATLAKTHNGQLVGKPEFNLYWDIYLNAIRIRLGHESLDVTLGYLKDKDAESEEAQGTCEQQQPSAVRISS